MATTDSPSGLDPARRTALNQLKLRALATSTFGSRHWADAAGHGAPAVIGDGEILVSLVIPTEEGVPFRGIGGTLVRASRSGVTGEVHLVVDGDAGVLARHANYFSTPAKVWSVSGAALVPVEPAPRLSTEHSAPRAEDLDAVSPLVAAGAETVVEHGVVLAEILGLEVGRVVDGQLEVGVGRFDREASAVMATLHSRDEVAADVVRKVLEQRRTTASPHLFNRMARARWMRCLALDHPELAGFDAATVLAPLDLPIERPNLVEMLPALAAGNDGDGNAVVVAFSVGVDLDCVAMAADARAGWNPDARLVFVTPPRDRYPAVVELARALRRPAEVVTMVGPWP